MKSTCLYIIISLLIAFFNPFNMLAQQPLSIRTKGYTAQKQAEGQTSWMTHYLKLDKSVSEVVYKINFKYLLQTDSLRLTTTEITSKKMLHHTITQRKNAELQFILSKDQYSKYMSMFSGVKPPVR